MWGAGIVLAEFGGNNFDYVEEGVIGSFAGNAARVSSKGNYLGLIPYGTSNLDREGELGEPIVRGEGDIGPRFGMTVDNPPVVPRIESAAVSSSDRKMVVLTYNVDIDEEPRPTKDAFTVRYRVASGVTGMITVDNVKVDGRTVVLTLEDEIPSGVSGLTVVYSTEAAGDSAFREKRRNRLRNGSAVYACGSGVWPKADRKLDRRFLFSRRSRCGRSGYAARPSSRNFLFRDKRGDGRVCPHGKFGFLSVRGTRY